MNKGYEIIITIITDTVDNDSSKRTVTTHTTQAYYQPISKH